MSKVSSGVIISVSMWRVVKNMDIEIKDIECGNGGTLAGDLGSIIERSKSVAYRAVDVVLVYRNWLLGKRIAEEELRGGLRAEYGKETMIRLLNN